MYSWFVSPFFPAAVRAGFQLNLDHLFTGPLGNLSVVLLCHPWE